MSSITSGRSKGKGKSKEYSQKSSKKSNHWSEWAWDEGRCARYRGRLGSNGEYVYEFDPPMTPDAATPRVFADGDATNGSDFDVNNLSNELRRSGISDYSHAESSSTAYQSNSQLSGIAFSPQRTIQSDGHNFSSFSSSAPAAAGEFMRAQAESTATNIPKYIPEHTPGRYSMFQEQNNQSIDGLSTTGNNYLPSYTPSHNNAAQLYSQGAGLISQAAAGEASSSGAATPKATSTNLIQGTPGNHESLDSRFKVHRSSKFAPGSVFKILWAEPYGETSKTKVTDCTFENQFGQKIQSKIRRMVVTATGSGHSQCIPIHTYGLQGTSKWGVKHHEHAIIYTGKCPPAKHPQEQEFQNSPIQVITNNPREKLDPLSRINYAKIYTVEHNVKVFFIGYVTTEAFRHVVTEVDNMWNIRMGYSS